MFFSGKAKDGDLLAAAIAKANANREIEIWPENWPAFSVFSSLRTQWRVAGMGSVIGLDYNVLFHKMDRMNLSADEYEQMESDIRTMEHAAMEAMSAQQ